MLKLGRGLVMSRGGNVEKTLVKTAIYSFFLSFSFMLVLIQREKHTTDVNGMGSVETTPFSEFIFMNLKFSIIITFIIVICTFLYKKYIR